ncbi:MAG TPA: GNAT family N-acetyltransferase [Thermoleophilaceae bacterium]|jgi:acetyltransferase
MKRLPGGAPILVRKIRPDDKELLVRGLAELSDRSVQRRFLAPKRRFTQRELRYLTEVDQHDHVALVAESPTQAVRSLIGVGRFVRLPEDPTAAEAAIVVDDLWQGMGLGTMLARELAARARGLGIRRFTATIASDNEPARKLLHKLNRDIRGGSVGHGVSELVLDLAA